MLRHHTCRLSSIDEVNHRVLTRKEPTVSALSTTLPLIRNGRTVGGSGTVAGPRKRRLESLHAPLTLHQHIARPSDDGGAQRKSIGLSLFLLGPASRNQDRVSEVRVIDDQSR